MAADLAVVTIHHPPKDGLPCLAVAITPDGKVEAGLISAAFAVRALGESCDAFCKLMAVTHLSSQTHTCQIVRCEYVPPSCFCERHLITPCAMKSRKLHQRGNGLTVRSGIVGFGVPLRTDARRDSSLGQR